MLSIKETIEQNGATLTKEQEKLYDIHMLADSMIPCGDRCDGTDDPYIDAKQCKECEKKIMEAFGRAVLGEI